MSGRDSGETLDLLDRELLRAAVEHDYFEDPGDTDLSDIAEEFEVTEAEATRRLARAMAVAYRRGVDDEAFPELDGFSGDSDSGASG